MKKYAQLLTTSVGGLVLILIVAGFAGYQWYQTNMALQAREQELQALQEELSNKETDYATLEEAFQAEKERNDAFANQIDDISGTVGKLDKLARTDPELLQKYSKVYFLNENYAPAAFEKIPAVWVYGDDDEYISAQVWPFLEDLLTDAKNDDIPLLVISAFRSFNTQASLKTSYKVTYGSGANAFSADQGYSEHQLGSTVDFTTAAIGGSFTGFDQSSAYAWLEKNAYTYGFILSYPKDNTYYQYEPWHWRFVGKALARDLHKENKHFYDLAQREIDEYLVSLFD